MIKRKYTIVTPRALLLLALALLLVWLCQIGWHAVQLWWLASQAERLVQDGGEPFEIDQAQEIVHGAAVHLAGLDADLRLVYPLLHLASGLPGVGETAGQVEPLVRYASALAQAGDLVFSAVAPAWAQSSSTSTTERIFSALVAGESQFDAAAGHLQEAEGARQEIQTSALPARVRALIERVDSHWPLLRAGVELLPFLPDLMGKDQPVTYLVLAQNHDELRATGGFISGIGSVTLRKGRLVDFQIDDSYAVDDFSKPYPSPPEPLQRFMLAGYWVARDANWSPDFPTAARQAQALVELSTGVATQGVIAFDQSAVSALLSATGSLSLPDVPELVTGENVETFMLQSWEPDAGVAVGGEWWLGRKDFMGILGRAILEQVLQVNEPKTLANLGKAILEILETGHLMAYLDQPEAQALLEKADLAHHITSGDGDFLMLVDSNVGFNKADAFVQRAIDYEVDLSDPEHPVARLSLHYAHGSEASATCEHGSSYGAGGSYTELGQRCYWDYWRVYVPAGSALLEAQVKPVPAEQLLSGQVWIGEVEVYAGEGGKQVFSGMLVLPTRGQESIRLEYDLPPQTLAADENGDLRYRLRVQKQPGIEVLPFQVQVRAPQGYALVAGSQGWKEVGDSIWIFSANLDRDQVVTLLLSPVSSAGQGSSQ